MRPELTAASGRRRNRGRRLTTHMIPILWTPSGSAGPSHTQRVLKPKLPSQDIVGLSDFSKQNSKSRKLTRDKPPLRRHASSTRPPRVIRASSTRPPRHASNADSRTGEALNPRTLGFPARRPHLPACNHSVTLRSLRLLRPPPTPMTAVARPAALAAVVCVALLAASCAAHDTPAPAAAPARRLLQDATPASDTTAASSSSTDVSFVRRSRGLLAAADTVWRRG